ncbi:MAG TPA: polysaccharide deacetylase family protein [Polyangia bacterium]|nr:polysaccharide deacetylase family protein [Polyangia bacterium]
MTRVAMFVGCAAMIAGCAMPGEGSSVEARKAAIVADDAITGDALPDYTLAFTYDDGPDDDTLDLAQYLHDQGIRATFFVNGCRFSGNPTPVPESGNCDQSGHISPSVLTTMTSLGHRIANHTEDHPDLRRIETDVNKVVQQLTSTQPYVDAHVSDGYYLFRPPYGSWDPQAAADIRTNSSLNKLTGPVLWDMTGADIDSDFGGDWNCLEHFVVEQGMTLEDGLNICGQYVLDAIDRRPHHNGVILFHDREEFAPGTNFALNLAVWVVEHLDRNVYTFVPLDAIPNLPGTANSPPPSMWLTHFTNAEGWDASRAYYGTIRYADLNNDGRADVCGRFKDGVYCATSNGSQFVNWKRWSTVMAGTSFDPEQYSTTMMLGDVNNDHRADLCFRGWQGIICALSTGTSFGTTTVWTPNGDYSDADSWGSDVGYYGSLRLGDINGDGRADICGRGGGGIYCGLSTGSRFQPKTGWKTDDFGDVQGWMPEMYSTTMQLADVNGDGRADICGRGGANNGIACALSNGASAFGAINWSTFMFTDVDHWSDTRARYDTIRFGRLDAGSVADVCGRNTTGIVCALGDGNGQFSRYRYINNSDFRDDVSWGEERYALTIGMADVNGDGKADICGRGVGGIVCSLTR